jgi:Transposase, Mutator family
VEGGDGSHSVHRVDLRSPAATRRGAEGGPPADSAGHCSGDENFFAVPPAHWIKVRTTHVIERAFREVRRRTRPMSNFSNVESCDRIVYAVISHLNVPGEENRSSNLHKTGTTLLFELDNFQITCKQYREGITVPGPNVPSTDS